MDTAAPLPDNGAPVRAGANPAELTVDVLARRLGELAGDERRIQVDFLLHLDEFDRRRAYLEAGYESLWSYCLRVLHLREGPAGRRINAMRVLRRLPRLEGPLRDGRLCLSTVNLLGPLLTPEKLDDLVARAAYRTKTEVEEIVASIQPRRAPKVGVRKVTLAPAPLRIASEPQPSSGADTNPRWAALAAGRPAALVPDTVAARAAHSAPALPVAHLTNLESTPPPVPAPFALAEPRRPVELKPIAAERWSLRVTLDAAMRADLETLASLLSHSRSGDL